MELTRVIAEDLSHGIVLISDSHSVEVPEWTPGAELAAAGSDGIISAIQHPQDGPTTIRVVDSPSDVAPGLVRLFEAEIFVASGQLLLTDAQLQPLAQVATKSRVSVSLHGDHPREPSRLDVVITPVPADEN